MPHPRLLSAVLLLCAGVPALAQQQAPAPAQVTFFDSKVFDGSLSKELARDADIVEVTINGKVSLNKIPERMDQWLTTVSENGELTLKQAEPQLKPKFVLSLAPMVFTMIKQFNSERAFDPAKKYNATIQYVVDRNGEPTIEKIIFTKKK
jgi:hypothetical protein